MHDLSIESKRKAPHMRCMNIGLASADLVNGPGGAASDNVEALGVVDRLAQLLGGLLERLVLGQQQVVEARVR